MLKTKENHLQYAIFMNHRRIGTIKFQKYNLNNCLFAYTELHIFVL